MSCSRLRFFPRTAREAPWRSGAALFFGWVKDPEPRFEVGDPRIRVQSYALYRVIVPLPGAGGRMNPVLRENLEVFFGEGHVLTVYFYLLIFLAPVEFVALYTQSLGEQMWRGSGSLLKVCASAALVLIVYFALRVANQEYAPERFKPLEHWLRERQARRSASWQEAGWRFSSCTSFVSLLLSAPLLIWAAAISRTPLPGLVATLALIPFYALCYGVWGLVASVLWERETESREFVVRCFILFVVVAALAVYLPLNPVVYLLAVLGRQELAPLSIAGVKWSADTVHFAFHLVLGGAGLAAHRWALKRVLERGHR